jgi:ribosome biogenesis GTPase
MIAARCRFADCSHTTEPDCAIAAALSTGDLSAERWSSYRKLAGEAARHQRMTDPLAAAEHKRRWKAIHRRQRELYRDRERI